MRTIQILLQLLQSIKTNPAVITRLPWTDIRQCILTELECRSDLYTPDWFRHATQLFAEILADAEQEAAACNTSKVIVLLEKIVFAMQALPESEYASQILCQANFDHACLQHYKNDTIIVLGDSHVNFFSGSEELSFLPMGHDINTCIMRTTYPFTPLHLGPCLAYNCRRYDTTYRFREKAEYLCQNFMKPHARVLCCLGEIDLRVHVIRQAAMQNRTFESIIDDILEQYLQFLCWLREKGYQVSCWGPIASQKENCPLDSRFPRYGSERERNQATSYFNRQLSTLCQKHGIPFLSIFTRMITSDYETLDKYLSPDRCHLSQNALPLALPEWRKIL